MGTIKLTAEQIMSNDSTISRQIKALAEGENLAMTHDTRTLTAALIRSIGLSTRIEQEEGEPMLRSLTEFFLGLPG